MQNNQFKLTTVLNVVITILIIVVLFMAINLYNKYQEDDKIKDDIQTIKEKNQKVKSHNKEVAALEKDQENKLQVEEVSNIATNFNDKFFIWDSWEKFSKNMENLRETYPNLKDNENVVIDGKDVGTGNSPNSDYESEQFISENKKEITEVIKQTKEYEEKSTEKIWYKVSNYNDGQYDITKFEDYEKVL